MCGVTFERIDPRTTWADNRTDPPHARSTALNSAACAVQPLACKIQWRTMHVRQQLGMPRVYVPDTGIAFNIPLFHRLLLLSCGTCNALCKGSSRSRKALPSLRLLVCIIRKLYSFRCLGVRLPVKAPFFLGSLVASRCHSLHLTPLTIHRPYGSFRPLSRNG